MVPVRKKDRGDLRKRTHKVDSGMIRMVRLSDQHISGAEDDVRAHIPDEINETSVPLFIDPAVQVREENEPYRSGKLTCIHFVRFDERAVHKSMLLPVRRNHFICGERIFTQEIMFPVSVQRVAHATLCALVRASVSLHLSSAHQSHPRGAYFHTGN